MKSKDKLRTSLNHQNGTVPVDFGSTAVTGIHCSVAAALRERYGLEKRPVKIHEPYQMLSLIDNDLRDALGIDVTGVFPRNTMFGFPIENWKEWTTPWGQDVLVPGEFNIRMDGSDVLIYPEGDRTAPPSGRMPESGYFFDSIVRQPAIDDESLDPQDNLEEFKPVTDDDL
ncbi:MAG: methyltransferase, partial [Spirochaetaceae bacterium]|nr:methyltransferase [Spirochaetaceae bacterium]